MSDFRRHLALAAGLPYLRQVVIYRDQLFTVMAYNFLNPPQVQLAPGIRHTALGWDTEAGDWVSWTRCAINKDDAQWVKEYKAQAVPLAEIAKPQASNQTKTATRRTNSNK